MSLNVLVIAEDPTYNGLILKPLVSALLADAGKPRAKIRVADKPRSRGYPDALRLIRNEFPNRFGHFDMWLFFPDADRAGPDAMERLESDLAQRNIQLLCCPAEPEVEIFACSGFRHAINIEWDAARTHPKLKEQIFQPLLLGPSLRDLPRRDRVSKGRARMIQQSLRNLSQLYRLCPELARLRRRIAEHL